MLVVRDGLLLFIRCMNVLVVFDVLDHSKHVLVLFVRPFLSFVPIQGPTMTTNAAPNATSKTQAMLPASSAIGDVNDDDESRATAAAWAAGTPRDADLDVDAASNTSVLRIPPSLAQGPTMTTNGELDADASRSFHTLGAAVPPFNMQCVRSNCRSIHPHRLLLPGNHLL